jgi:hypothetical protein
MCPNGGWFPNAVPPSNANQYLPVLEAHRIPLEHTGRTTPILVLAISIEKRVPETLFFSAPSFQFSLRTRLRSLPLAPFNASYEGGADTCNTLKVKGVISRTTRDCLLQIFEILHPGTS